MNKTFDRYAGIVFLALGSLFVVESQKITASAYGSNVGSNIFPLGLGIFLALMSVRLIYETFRYKDTGRDKEKLDYKRFGIIFSAAVLYAYFLEDIGFVIATFLFLMIGFQTMQRGKIWPSIIISAAFSFGVYYLFVHVMDGTLPGFPSWLGLE
ncbi:tripartite tricarboxylate transporter TctB family protein [Paenibacillus radicis (ex Xue et al. 2023)]|uniref:Tripartite tricarboxylate transporter TctB family protein n=1 Tax=Paenibacillus radicis (ex Xue et al. 2023) TaxID=2972489 RepID=A0ABT1YEY8_9BACL|nr:tripartite tricarboxylate transporter TctB family protein [Paenibacillus radicis (ex Xue et al. 2023)]MCR8631744.1 tripartite tricarboxylate transporter TctB family protein [Paenibacillus radicis (ex Xue et al. 2023)]